MIFLAQNVPNFEIFSCNLLPALAASDPNLLEDISVYGHDLPANYCIVDAALNHRTVGGFCFPIERLCLILGVPLDEVPSPCDVVSK